MDCENLSRYVTCNLPRESGFLFMKEISIISIETIPLVCDHSCNLFCGFNVLRKQER